mgnify:CR=1 FL=1
MDCGPQNSALEISNGTELRKREDGRQGRLSAVAKSEQGSQGRKTRSMGRSWPRWPRSTLARRSTPGMIR